MLLKARLKTNCFIKKEHREKIVGQDTIMTENLAKKFVIIGLDPIIIPERTDYIFKNQNIFSYQS